MRVRKKTEEISDGRKLYLYQFEDGPEEVTEESNPQVDSQPPLKNQEQDNE